MAAVGYTPISLFYSITAAAQPTAGSLVNGELAINITDGKLYYKDNTGTVQLLAQKGGNGVTTFSAGTTGLTPNTATSGAVTLAGTLATTNGGTGLTSLTAGSMVYGAGTSAYNTLAIGTANQILTSSGTAPQWTTLSGVAVTTLSFGTTGLTPSSATSGAITVAGTLATTNGGTGLTAFTANQVFYASSTSAIAQSANMTFNGTSLTLANDATIHGLTVGQGLTAGQNGVALGLNALAANTGLNNTAVGTVALSANTSGIGNTALGAAALASNQTGNSNTAVGLLTLNACTGSNNTALGANALQYVTSGTNNTAVGDQALNQTTASNNTAVGYQAGYSNTTGTGLTCIGWKAGYSYNTGFGSTFIGTQAGQNSTGDTNTFVGQGAGYQMTTGSLNTILGAFGGNNGGLDIRTASGYIVLSDGYGNPRQVIDNNGSVLIACTTDPSATVAGCRFNNPTTFSPRISTGSATGPATMLFFTNGNGDIGSISTSGSTTTYSTSSDYRLKDNVQPMQNALDVVAQLNPVTYNWIADGSDGQGFIAHELQAVVPDCVSGEKDAVDEEGNPVYQGIDTSFLVATLTAAIKELSAKNDALEARIATLEAK